MIKRATPLQQWVQLSTSAKVLLISCIAAAPIIGYMSVMTGLIGHGKPVFLFAVPVVLLLALAVLIEPYALLLLILLTRGGLDPFLEATKIPLGSASMGLGGVLNGLIIVLAIILAKETNSTSLRKILKWSMPLCIVFFISSLRSPNVGEAIKFTLGIATYLSAFALGVLLTEKKGLDYTLRITLYASVPAIAISSLMLLTGWRAPSTVLAAGDLVGATDRFAGAFSHPNIMAFFLTNTIAITLYFLSKERKSYEQPATGVLISLLLVAAGLIVTSKTRSAWAATALILVLYGVIFNRKVLLYLLLGAVGVTFLPAVQDRILDLSDDRGYLIYSTLNSYVWRKQLWSDGLNHLSWMGWIWGNGVRSFFIESTTFFKLSGGTPFGAHSIYVQLIYEMGLVGLIAWLGVVLGIAIRFLRLWRKRKDVAFTGMCLIISYATVCYSDNILNYLVYNIYLWIAIGSMVSISATAGEATVSTRHTLSHGANLPVDRHIAR